MPCLYDAHIFFIIQSYALRFFVLRRILLLLCVGCLDPRHLRLFQELYMAQTSHVKHILSTSWTNIMMSLIVIRPDSVCILNVSSAVRFRVAAPTAEHIGFQRRAGAVTFHASLDAAVLPCGMLPYLSSLLGSFQQLCR